MSAQKLNTMKSVALIHTVPTVYATFGAQIKEHIPDLKVTNTVDEFLASDAEEQGLMTPTNRSRLFALLKTSEATGADVIVVTCSTLSPMVDELRPYIGIPMLTIDEAMLSEAVQLGERILVAATANSTIGPTTDHLEIQATKAGKQVAVSHVVCSDAYKAIKNRDTDGHDRSVLAALENIKDVDVIVLAQASMAHLEARVADSTGVPVVSSPNRCIRKLSEVLMASP